MKLRLSLSKTRSKAGSNAKGGGCTWNPFSPQMTLKRKCPRKKSSLKQSTSTGDKLWSSSSKNPTFGKELKATKLKMSLNKITKPLIKYKRAYQNTLSLKENPFPGSFFCLMRSSWKSLPKPRTQKPFKGTLTNVLKLFPF